MQESQGAKTVNCRASRVYLEDLDYLDHPLLFGRFVPNPLGDFITAYVGLTEPGVGSVTPACKYCNGDRRTQRPGHTQDCRGHELVSVVRQGSHMHGDRA
jgi:hypothetical protein